MKRTDGSTHITAANTVRDRFWAWAHDAHSYDNEWGLPKNGRMTPVEGAHYLGVPNIIMIRRAGKPTLPFEQYAVPFKSLKRVCWSITGGGGVTSDEERKHVLQLASSMPNMMGVFMDDFFLFGPEGDKPQDEKAGTSAVSAALTVEQVRGIRKQLEDVKGRKLDVGVTLYTHQFCEASRIRAHLELCDIVSQWTWNPRDLKSLPENLEKLKAIVADREIWLGCYMWDFANSKPITIDLMRYQCELGLKWLKQGKIGAMIFLATNICDLDLEAVEWTRQWIAEVGDQTL
jgi:hypothetical protein